MSLIFQQTIVAQTPCTSTDLANFTLSANGCDVTASGTVPPNATLNVWAFQGLGNCYTNDLKKPIFTCDVSGIAPFLRSVTVVHSVQANGISSQCMQTIVLNALQMSVNLLSTQINGNVASVQFQVCMNQGGIPTTNNAITLRPTLPAGLSILDGGGFTNGIATINANALQAGGCITLTMQVQATTGFGCTDYNIALNPVASCTNFTLGQGTNPISIANQSFTISNDNLSNWYDLASHTWTFPTNNLVFDGDIIADVDDAQSIAPNLTYLDGYDIKFTAGSSLMVATNSGLWLRSSSLSGCDAMWRGLVAEDGEGLVIIDNNSFIQDALVGLAYRFRNVEINDATFRKCNVGLHANGGFSPVFIQNTTFQGGILLNGEQANIGIQLDNIPVVEYNSNLNLGGANFLTKLKYGVGASNCGRLFVSSEVFENMIGAKGSFEGSGIYFQGGSLTYKSALGSDFRRCNNGIMGFFSNGENIIEEADMKDVNRGIMLFSRGGDYVSSNRIQSNELGIGIDALFGEKDNKVEENTITATDGGGISIWGERVINYIYHNPTTVLGQSSAFGISATEAKTRICYNPITLKSGRETGIRIGGGASNMLENEIFGYDKSRNTGISITNSAGYRQCNTVSDTYYGINFNGACSSSFIKNDFKSNSYGLYMEKTAEIGPQGYFQNESGQQYANTWDNAHLLFGAFHEGSPAQYQKSLFYINEKINPKFKPTNPFKDWFVSSPVIKSVADCNEDICQGELSVTTPIIKDYDEDVATRDIQSNIDVRSQTRDNLLQKNLYIAIQNGEKGIDNSTILSEFVAEKSKQNIGKYYEIETALSQMLLTDLAAQIAEKEQQLNEQQVKMIEKATALRRVIVKSPLGTPTLWNDYKEARKEVHTLYFDLEALKTIAKNSSNEKAKEIKILTEKLAITTQDEYNEKTVCDIYLDLFLSENKTLTEEQEATLYHIALQCPLEGGNAVFKARTILFTFQKELDVDDRELCTLSSEDSAPALSKIKKEVTRSVVYPNPANQLLKIQLPATMKGEAEVSLELYDATGKIVLQKEVLFSQTSINIGHLDKGVYFYRIRSAIETQKNTGTLIIQR